MSGCGSRSIGVNGVDSVWIFVHGNKFKTSSGGLYGSQFEGVRSIIRSDGQRWFAEEKKVQVNLGLIPIKDLGSTIVVQIRIFFGVLLGSFYDKNTKRRTVTDNECDNNGVSAMIWIEASFSGLISCVSVLTCDDCGNFVLLLIGSVLIEFKDHDLGKNNGGDTATILGKTSSGDYGAAIGFDGLAIRIRVESITHDTRFSDWRSLLGGKDLETYLATDSEISGVCGLGPAQLTTGDLDLLLRIEYTVLVFGFSGELLVFTERLRRQILEWIAFDSIPCGYYDIGLTFCSEDCAGYEYGDFGQFSSSRDRLEWEMKNKDVTLRIRGFESIFFGGISLSFWYLGYYQFWKQILKSGFSFVAMLSSYDDLLGEEEEDHVQMDTVDAEETTVDQVAVLSNEGDMMDMGQDVNELHTAKHDGKQFERNQVGKKKPFRNNIAIGGGATRLLTRVSTTPRKKFASKGDFGDKMGEKVGKDDDEPAGGKSKGKIFEK